MKYLSSILLLGALLSLLAPATAAQRVHASRHSGHALRGYSHASSAGPVWIAGGYETVEQRVWVPGCVERVWVEPTFALRIGSCGERFRVLVTAGHWRTVQRAGHYEIRRVRAWAPGRWLERRSGC